MKIKTVVPNPPKKRVAYKGTRTNKDSKSDSKYPDHGKLLGWLRFADEASKKANWDAFVIDQFLKGNHSIRGNSADNSISVKKDQERINFPINKIYSTFRAVRAFVTRHKPKVEIDIEEASDEAKTYARRANSVLERDNQLNNSRLVNKEWVYYGLKGGRGWRQVGYDKEKKCSVRWTVDPVDMLVGAKTGRWQDAPYLIKNIVRTVGYWKDKFPKKNIIPDNLVAYDQYKQLAHQIANTNGINQPNSEDEGTAIGHECWYRLLEPNSMGGLINKCLFTDTESLSEEETPYTEYPFVTYDPQIEPNVLHPQSFIVHEIPAQRMFNLLNTQLLEYNFIVNRGRILKDKNAGFSSVFAKEGHIIERKSGKRVEVLPPPPVNPVLQAQLTMSEGWIEELSGSSDASRGLSPYSGASGRAIENLQMADSNNVADYRDNFEDALAQEATLILKMYSLFEEEGFVMKKELKDDETDQYGVVGAKAYSGPKDKYYMEDDGTYCSMCAILPDNKVKVSVTSELGETKAARIELLMKLVEVGLPLKTLLEFLEFPNTPDILERIASEAVAQSLVDQMGQAQQPGMPPTGGPEGQVPQETGPLPPPPSDDLQDIQNALG